MYQEAIDVVHAKVILPKRRRSIIRVADEAWLGLALLHREHPERESFTAKEILERIIFERATPELRPGVLPHIYQHNVANLPPNPARYRMYWKLPDDTYRLFRLGDCSHPLRTGKIKPDREEFEQYRYLFDWYDKEYCKKPSMTREEDDPILSMRGVGKEVWSGVDADEYVRSLRSNWYGGERNGE